MRRIYNQTNMAAPLAAFRTAVKGLHLHGPCWISRTPALFSFSRPLPGSEFFRGNSSAEPHRSSRTEPSPEAKDQKDPEEPLQYIYIPRKKGKNPHITVGYAWLFGLPLGVISFFLAKREVERRRLKQLKIRRRMRNSNTGDDGEIRYRGYRD